MRITKLQIQRVNWKKIELTRYFFIGQQCKEIEVKGFDEENTPIIRIFDNNTSYLIFEEFPPENEKLSSSQIDNFEIVLSEITGVKIVRDDRELFIIYSNDENTLNKVISFFDSL